MHCRLTFGASHRALQITETADVADQPDKLRPTHDDFGKLTQRVDF
jgi:hypothetical protein